MKNSSHQPITLATQGSFAVGGTYATDEHGNSLAADHAYVQYQVPVETRKYPLVMWHGGGQFSKTWESTPDGRDGFQNIFLRRGYTTYILDQPRRGRGGRASAGAVIPAALPFAASGFNDALLYNVFRLGTWRPPQPPVFFPNVQFPRDPESLDQYWRQVAPNIGPEGWDSVTRDLMTDVAAALFAKTGPAVLLTHSNSGQYGWLTRIKAPNVKAIVSYEPVSFVFPVDAPPPAITTDSPPVATLADPIFVDSAQFRKLVEIPIQLVYGDNIETGKPSSDFGVELWRVTVERARHFRDAINARGGQVEILDLPTAGLRGNTHFPFSDLNNIEVADLLSAYLERHKLDVR
jgi:hypothetical protein